MGLKTLTGVLSEPNTYIHVFFYITEPECSVELSLLNYQVTFFPIFNMSGGICHICVVFSHLPWRTTDRELLFHSMQIYLLPLFSLGPFPKAAHQKNADYLGFFFLLFLKRCTGEHQTCERIAHSQFIDPTFSYNVCRWRKAKTSTPQLGLLPRQLLKWDRLLATGAH